MTEVLVFVDESLRSGRYLLGCVVVDATAAGLLRRNLRKLLLPNERRIHIRKARRPQRLQILTTLALWNLDSRVYECLHRDSVGSEQARQRCIERMVEDLQASGSAATVYFERRDGADHRDRETIIRARKRTPSLEFHHRLPTDDALLWLPDCIAWAVGAGAEWHEALAGTVDVIRVG